MGCFGSGPPKLPSGQLLWKLNGTLCVCVFFPLLCFVLVVLFIFWGEDGVGVGDGVLASLKGCD